MDFITAFVFLIVIMLICMGFLLPSCKGLFYWQAAVMWIMLSFNNGGADYQANEELFLAAEVSGIKDFFLDSGIYRISCFWFRKLGLGFFHAYCIVSTMALAAMLRIIYRSTEKRCLALSLCMLYPFSDFIIQKRNFLIVPILLYTLPFLFKNTKKGDCIYWLGCIICGLIHVTGYVYLLFFFVYKVLSIRKVKKYFGLNIGALLLIEIFLLPVLPKIAFLFFPKGKVETYFLTVTSSLKGTLYTISAHLMFFFIVEYMNRRCKKNNYNEKLMDHLSYFNKISILFTPIYFYGAVFARIYVYMLPYTYILLSNVDFKFRLPRKSALAIYTASLCGVILVALMNYGIYNDGFHGLIVPLLEENVLIRLLAAGMF